MKKTKITVYDNVYVDADVEIDIDIDHVKEYITECEESEAKEILVALNQKSLNSIIPNNTLTLDDEFKVRLMNKAMKKYSLDELEKRLEIDWL